jgi:autotransporter-associated beta strand protein
MSGSGSLTLTPICTGTTGTISGNNTYAGDTTVAANNTLKLGSNYAVPSGSGKGNVTVTGTLDLNAYSPVVNGLSGAGTVDNKVAGTPLMTVGDNDQTSTFSGVIKNTAGTLSLCKLGSGTLTLAGANTYGGNTALSAGTLSLSPTVAGGNLADGADVYLTTGSALDLSTSGAEDTIRALYIDGVPQAVGVWAASAGAGVDHVSTLITGTGKLGVTELAVGATYSISGTVTENGVGLTGVTVTDGTRTSESTGVDGVYMIANVPDGITYTVTPSKSGYTFTPANLSLMLSGANQTGNHFTATAASSTPYDTWKAGPFANAFNDTDPASDPDGDNQTNQQEFAFGLDPTSGASVNPITQQLDSATGTFKYTRWAASGLDYKVELSTDLLGWDPATTLESIGDPDTNGVQTVTVTLDPYTPPPGGKLFVRVRAE